MIFLVLIVAFVLCADETKVVQVHFLSRHCDRTTEYAQKFLVNYPKKTNVDEILGISNGELSALGARECYIMGEKVRNRYLNSSSRYFIQNIQPSWNSDDYYFESTSFDRTILSGYSIALGLFPNFAGQKIDVGLYGGNYSYPYGEQGVPYVTIQNENSVLFATNNCQKIVQNRNYLKNAQLQKFYNDNIDEFHKISNVTGNDISNVMDFWYVFDLLHVLYFHDLLPDEVKNSIWEKSLSLGEEMFKLMYNRNTLIDLGGSPFLEILLDNIYNFIKPSQENDIAIDSKKFLHYSGHETSMIGVLSAMDVLWNDKLSGLPPYGSGILFEVRQDMKSKLYTVQLYYLDGWDGDFVQYKLTNCEYNCPVDEFRDYIRQTGISQNWCDSCGGNPVGDFCLNQRIHNLMGNEDKLEKNNKDLESEIHDLKQRRDLYFYLMIVFIVIGVLIAACSVFVIILSCVVGGGITGAGTKGVKMLSSKFNVNEKDYERITSYDDIK